MTTVPLPQRGGCVCGGVRYSLNAAPLLAYACHCHDCQRRSGGAFTLTLVLRTDGFAHTGETRTHALTTRTGRLIEQNVCPACRTSVFSRAPVAPDYMSLRVGTLDDASWVRPIAQAYVESAIPWAVIPGVRAVDWADFDFVALGEEWQASAPAFRAEG